METGPWAACIGGPNLVWGDPEGCIEKESIGIPIERECEGPGPDLSGQNLVFSDVPSQTRVANHFAVAPSVHGVPHLHGSMRLVEPHRTI